MSTTATETTSVHDLYPVQVSVTGITDEAGGIKSFVLAASDGQTLPPAAPGSHIDVQIGEGLSRQYSLYNAGSGEDCYRIAVLKELHGRGGSLAMHELEEGALLRVSAPRDRFPLHAGKHHVLVAGGIGITPILSMADDLSRLGCSFELHYATRSMDRAAFARELQSRAYAKRVSLYFSDQNSSINLNTLVSSATSRQAQIYVCGPDGLIKAVYAIARGQGMPEECVHSERFAAEQKPVPDTSVDNLLEDSNEFEVVISSTGQTLFVDSGSTVAEVLIAAGIDLPLSCEEGICGTCETRILEGVPKHNDVYLTKDEKASNGVFTPCCSRAKSKVLLLDL